MTSSFPEILLTPEFGVTCYGISKVQGRHFKRFQPWYIFCILKSLPTQGAACIVENSRQSKKSVRLKNINNNNLDIS